MNFQSRMSMADSRGRAGELKIRAKEFVIRVFRRVDAIPKTIQGRTLPDQIIRGVSSIAANCRPGDRARSRSEFIANIRIVEEEADQTVFWPEVIGETDLLPESKLRVAMQAADELVPGMAASLKSLIANRQSQIF